MTDNRLPVFEMTAAQSMTENHIHHAVIPCTDKGNIPACQTETLRVQATPLQDKGWRMHTKILHSLTLKEKHAHYVPYLRDHFEIEVPYYLSAMPTL